MTTLSRVVAQKIERVLALGYVEAQQRKLPHSRLDALLEVTVAVCDMFPPSTSGDQFYVSDVQLVCEDSAEKLEIGSSLASFDDDLRKQLEQWFGIRHTCSLGDGISLRIPAEAKQAAPLLEGFWNECSRDISLDWSILRSLPLSSEEQNHVAQEIWDHFDQSLRIAFDALAREDPDHIYTIRFDRRPGGPYGVMDAHQVAYCMGYWLSTGMLLHLQNPKEEKKRFNRSQIDKLETVWKPTPRTMLRTQSHTNVESRLAGIIRQQQRRSRWLRPNSRPDKWEIKAWGTPPKSIYMMPLVNYELCQIARDIRTIAHAYFPIIKEQDIVQLLATRYRLSIIFSEALYEEYCRCLARELADKILSSWHSEDIEDRCAQVARAFGASKPCQVISSESGEVKLGDRLQELKLKTVLRFDEREWPAQESLLHNVCVDWSDERLELDVLPHLIDHVGVLAARQESGMRVARQIVEQEMRDLEESVHAIQATHQKLNDALARQRPIGLSLLTVLGRFFAGNMPPCKASPRPFEGWSFRPGHQYCFCNDCRVELHNRMGYLFSGKPGENGTVDWIGSEKGEQAACRLRKMCGDDDGKLWEVIKHGCQKSTLQEPTVAAIVILLLKHGATDVAMSLFKTEYKAKLNANTFDWETSLGGILGLAMWEWHPDWKRKQPGQHASIELKIDGDKLHFVILGKDLDYEKWLKKKESQLRQRKTDNIWWKHSRSQQVAAAFAYRRDSMSRIDDHIVEMELSAPERVVWTWRLIAQSVDGSKE